MPSIVLKELLEAGVHFGHQTKRWNPKMQKFIFGERNGIHIIDLKKTVQRFESACRFVKESVAAGRPVLFVGTKKSVQDIVQQEARRCEMFYVTERWLGGMLTNFQTIRKSIARLDQIEAMQKDGRMDRLPKKEVARLEKEQQRLLKILDGIRKMTGLPGAVFVTDTKKERIAVYEAKRLRIPVVAILDTNCDPEEVDHVIPGNDDSIRSVKLITARLADAVIEGLQLRASQAAAAGAEKKPDLVTTAELTAADPAIEAETDLETEEETV
jgi:small subunit ribosomal protein S2